MACLMGAHPNTTWDIEHSNELLALLADGKSFSQSAAALNEKFNTNYSRNAACGKAFRLSFKVPKKARAIPKPRKRDRERIIKPKPRIEEIRIRCLEIEPRHLTLVQLEHDDCRYPFGDNPFTFCGRLVMDGKSYCPDHFRLVTAKERTVDQGVTDARARRMRGINFRKALLEVHP